MQKNATKKRREDRQHETNSYVNSSITSELVPLTNPQMNELIDHIRKLQVVNMNGNGIINEVHSTLFSDLEKSVNASYSNDMPQEW